MVLDTSDASVRSAIVTAAGVPGAQRIDHVALTVADLDAAIDFVVRGLGGEVIYRLPPLTREDDWMREHLDVDPRASAEIALLRLGPTTNLELFEYAAPDHDPTPPSRSDIGCQHLGLLVDDVDAAAAALTRRTGLAPSGPVRTAPDGTPDAGIRAIRFEVPWGLAIEVRSIPDGLPYERATEARRYRPEPARDGSEPSLCIVDHIGYTVADIDDALAMFVDVLGGELLYRTADHAALRMGPTDNIELYAHPGASARTEPPRNSDVGGRHLALHVQDVDAAAAYLGAVPGFRVLGAPETIGDGPIAGDRWVYVRSPLGLHIEVVRMPDGSLPYERDTTARRRAAGDLRWSDR